MNELQTTQSLLLYQLSSLGSNGESGVANLTLLNVATLNLPLWSTYSTCSLDL